MSNNNQNNNRIQPGAVDVSGVADVPGSDPAGAQSPWGDHRNGGRRGLELLRAHVAEFWGTDDAARLALYAYEMGHHDGVTEHLQDEPKARPAWLEER